MNAADHPVTWVGRIVLETYHRWRHYNGRRWPNNFVRALEQQRMIAPQMAELE
jgi:hypothetical protein